jgi:hypothetical protein
MVSTIGGAPRLIPRLAIMFDNVSLFYSGPFLAIIAALVGKYTADRNQGPIGDSVRAVGRIAAAAGKKAQEERLLCKIKAAIRSMISKDDCHHCAEQK